MQPTMDVTDITDDSTNFGCCYEEGWADEVEILHANALANDDNDVDPNNSVIGSYDDLTSETKDGLTKYV